MGPLRIGLVTDTWFPARNGVVATVATLHLELVRLGHEVTVLAVGADGGSDRDGVERFRGLRLLASVEGRLGLITARAAQRVVSRADLDLLHTHTEFAAGWAARRVAQRLCLPLVHTLHTPWDRYRHYLPGGDHLPEGAVRRLLARYVAPAALVSVPSAKARHWAEPWAGERPLVVVGNPVADQFRPPSPGARRDARQAHGFGPDHRVALVVGRLAPEKRVVPLLTALAPALREAHRVVVVFVGSGPDRSILARVAQRFGVADRVRLEGAASWEEMAQWYAAADVVVSASRAEFQPLAVLEAMACGLPVVAGPDPAFDSLVRHGDNGLRASTDAGLAASVLQVLRDADLHRRLGAGSVAAGRHHRGENVALRWEAIYRDLLEQWPAPAASCRGDHTWSHDGPRVADANLSRSRPHTGPESHALRAPAVRLRSTHEARARHMPRAKEEE